MQTWLQGGQAANPTELYGVARWALSLRGHVERQLTQAVDVIRWFAATELDTARPEVFEACRPWIDTILTHLYQRAKVQKVTVVDFVGLYGPMLNMLIDQEGLQAMVSMPANACHKIGEVLRRVVANSKVGWGHVELRLAQGAE